VLAFKHGCSQYSSTGYNVYSLCRTEAATSDPLPSRIRRTAASIHFQLHVRHIM
jgi:hypothetical protein